MQSVGERTMKLGEVTVEIDSRWREEREIVRKKPRQLEKKRKKKRLRMGRECLERSEARERGSIRGGMIRWPLVWLVVWSAAGCSSHSSLS